MAKATTKKKPEDESLEQNAPQETGDETSDMEELSEEIADELEASDEPVTAVVSSDITPSAPLDLQRRITWAARSIATHGGQEKSHALNQIELLTGRLKMALPAAITAVADQDLKAGLEQLLNLL